MEIQKQMDGSWRYVCSECGEPATGWYEPQEPYYSIWLDCTSCKQNGAKIRNAASQNLDNIYCPTCRKTTKHKVSNDGHTQCLQCQQDKVPSQMAFKPAQNAAKHVPPSDC